MTGSFMDCTSPANVLSAKSRGCYAGNLLMPQTSSAFVGRYEERRIIEQAFEQARERGGVGLLIDGLAGTGKSRLVEYALAESARHGFLPLFGTATEGQEGVPYGLMLEAFRRHLRAQAGAIPAWLGSPSAWTEL